MKASNLVILVMLKNGNHPGEAEVGKSRRKAIQNREGLLREPHEEAEFCTNQQSPQRGGAVLTLFEFGRNARWPSCGSQLPHALPFIF